MKYTYKRIYVLSIARELNIDHKTVQEVLECFKERVSADLSRKGSFVWYGVLKFQADSKGRLRINAKVSKSLHDRVRRIRQDRHNAG